MDMFTKDCSSKFRSRHSALLVMCLLRNLLEQSLYEQVFILTETEEVVFHECSCKGAKREL